MEVLFLLSFIAIISLYAPNRWMEIHNPGIYKKKDILAEDNFHFL